MAEDDGLMEVDLLITDACEVLTCSANGSTGVRGSRLERLDILQGASVAVDDGRIIDIGPSVELARRYRSSNVIDASNRVVSPGLVDPHTHLIYDGHRFREWGDSIRGSELSSGLASGIGVTRSATAAASGCRLEAALLRRLDVMLEYGTTTAEVKTGYGHDAVDEIRLLEVIARVHHPVSVIRTFLGAQAIADRSTSRQVAGSVVSQLDEASHFAEFIDICCDPVAFDRTESEYIATHAAERGLGLRVHADQTGHAEGVEFGVGFGAKSVDHLEFVSDKGINLLAESDTVAILLPTVSYHTFALVRRPGANGWLDVPQPWLAERFRRLIDEGGLVALGTDHNPGTSPTLSMQAVMQAAARLYRLSYSEIWYASTINGAVSIGRDEDVGSLEVGKLADVVIWDVPSHELVINQFGTNFVDTVVKSGRVVYRRGMHI